MTMDQTFTIQTTIEVSLKRIRDLLCGAFEGGSNYWLNVVEPVLAPGLSFADFMRDGKFSDPNDYWPSYCIIPFHEGCSLRPILLDEDDSTPALLNLESIKKGLDLFSSDERYFRHFKDFIDENDDAITSDVFLQLCVFGEVIYS